MKRLSALLLLSPLFLVALGCEASKSADPLSPSVAGPIAGVNITAPKPLEPNGSRVASDQQPLTLLAENASTTGVRPLSYVFEVATDAGFTNTVFSRDGIAPGDGGRTSLRLPDPLQSGRTYYWRARAQDGANTGPYSGPANFDVFTPIVIEQPTLIAPTRVVVTENLHPVFQWNNAPRSGPVGAITYFIELSDTDSFANKLAVWTTGEQPNQTNLNSPQDLSYGKIYFWHVKAYDPSTQGPWSSTEAFQTPLPPPPPPTGGGGGGGGGGGNGDWRKCGSTPGEPLVRCVHASVNPGNTVEGAFEVTKRVAWLLRGGGAGLLIKNGGENIVSWKGRSFAAARICYPDGHIYKVLSDVPTTNGPSWQDNGFVDRSLYVPAIDPDS
jgi:hypothetical protein